MLLHYYLVIGCLSDDGAWVVDNEKGGLNFHYLACMLSFA